MKNPQVVRIFRNIAAILEIKGENVFRVRAYNRAADVIEGLSDDVAELAEKDGLTNIPGIGKDLAGKISEISATGSCQAYDRLRKEVPEGLLEMLSIPTLGPKTAKLLYDHLKVKNIDELERAVRDGRLKGLPKVREKTIANIEKGIALVKKGRERMPLAVAMEAAGRFIGALSAAKEVDRISEAGSLRRRRETVRDIDILVTSREPETVMERFTRLPWVSDVVAKGGTKSTIRTEEGIQVDCRVVEDRSFGASMIYFTGSKNFNIRLRSMAQKKGWKVNEYGVFESGTESPEGSGRLLAGKTEEEVFSLFGMQFIPPELREDTGEFELALKRRLPELVTLRDIKGDLHSHSKWSDGGNTIGEMAEKARSLGYSYLAVTDHSRSLKIAGGLDIGDLKKKKREIDRLNSGLRGFRILFGTEVDINIDGSIDYPDDVLKDFDVVVAAVHTGLKNPRRQITQRIVSACRNRHVHIIAHPTQRLWGARDGYDFDLEEVLAAAADTNTALEVNSFPSRLDLNDQNCRLAKERGVKIAVNTDSHAVAHLENMKLGIAVARRGWLEPSDVINTLPLEQLLRQLKK